MKLLVPYNNDVSLLESDFDIFLLSQEGLNSHYQHETTDVAQTIQNIHALNKEVYGWINRFIFETEMDEVTNKIVELIHHGVDGFMVNDFGLFLKLKEIGFDKPILLSTDTTITNHLEVKFLIESGFDKVVTARELTFDELIDLSKEVSQSMIVPIFGHQIISTSRRQLLKAYGDLVQKQYDQNHIYQLRESTRSDQFLVYEDETGTHIFDQKVFVGFHGLKQLVEHHVNAYLIDSFNIETKTLVLVSKLLKQIGINEITPQEATVQISEISPNTEFTTALWHLKTTDKKEDNA